MAKETVYTNEVVERMEAAYTAVETEEARDTVVRELADELGVKVQSVRAKLSNMGVYIPKQRVTKDGAKVESKAQIVANIAALLEVEEEVVESLEKATKPVLKMIRTALVDVQ